MTSNPGNAETLRPDHAYPIALGEWKNLPLHIRRSTKAEEIGAVWSQEVRPPKAGEWYLSGAIIEAHFAPNDLTQNHAIARLQRVQTVKIARDI